MRVGLGFDARPLEGGHPPVLGGVSISYAPGAAEPAEGDVVCRALASALLGAAGLESAPGLRGPGDDRRGGSDPLRELEEVVRRVEGENYQVVNVDVTVLADGVGLEEHRGEMAALLAGLLHIAPGAVSVKEGPPGGDGWPGGGARVAALAVALLDQMEDLDSLHAALRSRG